MNAPIHSILKAQRCFVSNKDVVVLGKHSGELGWVCWVSICHVGPRAGLGSSSRLGSRLLWLVEFSKESAGLCQLVGLL